jgi:hypothetical protein
MPRAWASCALNGLMPSSSGTLSTLRSFNLAISDMVIVGVTLTRKRRPTAVRGPGRRASRASSLKARTITLSGLP